MDSSKDIKFQFYSMYSTFTHLMLATPLQITGTQFVETDVQKILGDVSTSQPRQRETECPTCYKPLQP